MFDKPMTIAPRIIADAMASIENTIDPHATVHTWMGSVGNFAHARHEPIFAFETRRGEGGVVYRNVIFDVTPGDAPATTGNRHYELAVSAPDTQVDIPGAPVGYMPLLDIGLPCGAVDALGRTLAHITDEGVRALATRIYDAMVMCSVKADA